MAVSLPAGSAPELTLEEIGKVNRNAQTDGIIMGTCAGVISGAFAQRLLRLSPKVSTFSALLTGVASGYIFSSQAIQVHLARAKQAKLLLVKEQPGGEFNMNRGESGHGGLEHLDDKYATTSGQH